MRVEYKDQPINGWSDGHTILKRCENTIENTTILDHKEFFIQFINCLIRWANTTQSKATTTYTITTPTVQQETDIVYRLSAAGDKNYILNQTNLSLDIFNHVRFVSGIHSLEKKHQKQCSYCRFLCLKAKAENQPEAKIKRSIYQCSLCKVHLCLDHFHIFHET